MGKFYIADRQGKDGTGGMTGHLEGPNRKELRGDELGRVIMQFLIRNRNGDIWVLTEPDLHRLLEIDDDRCKFVEDPEVYIKAPVEPLPCGKTEVLTPFGVRRLLEAFNAKEPTFGDSGETLV